MDILDRQQIGLPGFQPIARRRLLTLRAMPIAAAVVGDPLVRAVGAALHVPAERRRPACLDGRATEMTAEVGNGVDVRLLRRRRQIADGHVLDHAPS